MSIMPLSVDVTWKRCSQCKQLKPRFCFSRTKKNSDGLNYQCRTCRKDYAREHRTWYTEAQRNRSKTERRQLQLRAYAAVRRAIKKGVLVRPPYCEQCGEPCKPHGHHYLGYEPEHHLHVRFLCKDCHGAADHGVVLAEAAE